MADEASSNLEKAKEVATAKEDSAEDEKNIQLSE